MPPAVALGLDRAELVGQDLGQGGLGGGHLRGDVDVLTAPALVSSVEGEHGSAGGIASGVSPGLGLRDANGRPVVVAGHQERRPGRPDGQVGADVVGLGAGLAEG